jgi:hypothetical protein
MNRAELAGELCVPPWDVDDWLLWGCPAKKIGNGWEFKLEKVSLWLQAHKIQVKRINRQHAAEFTFDERWFKGRCPMCIDRGFSGPQAGRVYTLGEVSEGEWHIRRTGIPCGHSTYFPVKTGKPKEELQVKRASEVMFKRERTLGTLSPTPEAKKRKIHEAQEKNKGRVL